MIIRMVRLSLHPEKLDEFLEIFNARKEAIRHVDGCQHLEVLQEVENPAVVFTYSHWKDTEALEAYRHSDFFRDTWSRIKPLFNEKAQAWSVERLLTVD